MATRRREHPMSPSVWEGVLAAAELFGIPAGLFARIVWDEVIEPAVRRRRRFRRRAR